jgi:guanylate kinase
MTILGGLKKGLVFVVSAPAGAGKTTLVRMLVEEFSCIVENVSYTTRKPRPLEVEGKDYHFITKDAFEQKIKKGDFLEYAEVFGDYYGTSKQSVEASISHGKHVVLIIDTQGAMAVKKCLHAVFIFIQPPSLDILKNRLHERKSDSIESIKVRLSWAEKEMDMASFFDYQIVNEKLEIAYQILRAILIAEEHKNTSNK